MIQDKTKMLTWLKTQKRDAEYHAPKELEHHGSDQYIAKQNDEAKLIEGIIEIVEAKIYVEETETIYVDIDKMIEKYKEEKPNILPGFIGLDPVTGQELYEVLEK